MYMDKFIHRVSLSLPLVFMVTISLVILISLYAMNDYFQFAGLAYVLFFTIRSVASIGSLYAIGYVVEKQITKHTK